MSDLEVKYLSTDDLVPYANNSRTHSDKQIMQVAASIKEFGFNNPILIDEHNGIIAGHGRLYAAQKLGLKVVPTIMLEGLTEAQRKAYVIADNKLALNAGWDNEALFTELQRLQEFDFNLDLLGFETDELSLLLNEVDFEPVTEKEQGKLDELDPKWIDCPHCGKEFDLRKHG